MGKQDDDIIVQNQKKIRERKQNNKSNGCSVKAENVNKHTGKKLKIQNRCIVKHLLQLDIKSDGDEKRDKRQTLWLFWFLKGAAFFDHRKKEAAFRVAVISWVYVTGYMALAIFVSVMVTEWAGHGGVGLNSKRWEKLKTQKGVHFVTFLLLKIQ